MTHKELIKKYQGKYYLGYEIGDENTYVFIKKVRKSQNPQETSFMTYSDVICYREDNAIFEQNREWCFGTNFIESYKYKAIKKSLFMSVVKQFGFPKPERGNKGYRLDFVNMECIG